MHPIRTDMHSAFQPLPRASAYAALGLCMAILVTGCAPSQALTEPDTALPAHYPAGDFAATASTTLACLRGKPWCKTALCSSCLSKPAPTTMTCALPCCAHKKHAQHMEFSVQTACPASALAAATRRVPGDLNASRQSVVGSDHEVFVGFNSWELDLWGRVRQLSRSSPAAIPRLGSRRASRTPSVVGASGAHLSGVARSRRPLGADAQHRAKPCRNAAHLHAPP